MYQLKLGAYSGGLQVKWVKKIGNMFTSHILWFKFITNHGKVITNYDKFLKIATGITNYDNIITNYDKTDVISQENQCCSPVPHENL